MNESLRIVLGSVIEVFGLVGVAWAYSRRFQPNLEGALRLTTHVLIPCLIFTSIQSAALAAGDLWTTAAATGIQIATGLTVGAIALRLLGWGTRRELLLPIAFVNSANLPFPLLVANFGPDGMAHGVPCFMVTTSAVFSIGLAILHGKAQWRSVLTEPVLWATALGLLTRFATVEIPDLALRIPRLAAQAAVPMMLILLGDSLSKTKFTSAREASVLVALRYGSGVLAMFLSLFLLQPEGMTRKIVILYALLPSAVVNVVITRRAGKPVDAVASAVLLATLLSAAILPLLLTWLHQH